MVGAPAECPEPQLNSKVACLRGPPWNAEVITWARLDVVRRGLCCPYVDACVAPANAQLLTRSEEECHTHGVCLPGDRERAPDGSWLVCNEQDRWEKILAPPRDVPSR